MKTAILIPVYNEGEIFGRFLQQVMKFADAEDIIIVDDGSTDGTCDGIENLTVNLLRHIDNSGKGNALKTGFRQAIEAGYDWVLCMDGDGQHVPEKIPDFISAANESKYQLIIGNRRKNLESMPWDRKFSNLITSSFLSLIAGYKIHDAQCGYRMYRTDFLKEVDLKTSDFDTENEILLKAFKRRAAIGWVDIPVVYGDETSHINRLSDTLKFIKLIIRYLLGINF
ncbi:MAG: glycosyltransferase family 2 protein [FCB group bacterium]|nr:glycosyltransferase family 2 protein [FCB group bacterium]